MQGSAEEALILLETDGEMFFKPTAVNSLSKRHYGVRNLARIALCFEWKMHSTDAEVLSIEPMTGVIQPNEKMVSRLAVNYGGQSNHRKLCQVGSQKITLVKKSHFFMKK